MKRNANAVSALLENFDIAEKALLESQNAAGSAMAENEKYLDSINGKLAQLKASWEQLSASVLDSELVKTAIDLVRELIELFNKLDEATNGVSSSLLAGGTAIVVLTSVLSAFSLKAKDSTSILGTLFGLLSKDTRTATISKIGEGFEKVSTAMRHAKEAGGGYLTSLASLIPVGGKVAIALGVIAVAIYGITKAYNAYRKANPTFEDLQEQTSEFQSEVDELSSSVEAATERISDLQKLADDGTISLTEQDELDRLKAQNELLEAQLQLKQALLDAKQDETHAKAQEDAEEFFSTTEPVTNQEAVDQRNTIAANTGTFEALSNLTPIEQLDMYRQSVQYCDDEIRRLTLSLDGMSEEQAKGVQKRIDELEAQRKKALELYSTTAEPLQDILDALDPSDAKDAELIKKIKNVTYQMQMLSGDATALKSVFDDFWSDTAAHPGIDKFKEKLEEAAEKQRDFNEELKQYGSNVDLTNRPHVEVTQDMVDTGIWDEAELGSYSTVKSITFTAQDLGLEGTQAILVTPIDPDGNVLGDENTIKDYVLKHCVEDGKLVADNAEGDYGITMAVVDEGSINASIIKAGELANKAHKANAAFHDLQEEDEWNDFLDVLETAGADIDGLSQKQLAEMFYAAAESAEAAATSITGVVEGLEALTEKSKLLKDAQDEFNTSGTISSSTLSDIVEKFPSLSESVSLYIAGVKSGKELLSDLAGAYQVDTEAFKDGLKSKLEASETFCKTLTEDQAQLIKDLAKSYGVDLQNFTTIEEAKLSVQSRILSKLAANNSRYVGAGLTQLKSRRAELLSYQEENRNDPALREELSMLNSAIKEMEAFQNAMDGIIDIDLDDFDPSKYGDQTSSSSDSYKTSVQEKINALKHQLQMEKITAEQYYNGLEAIENQYYKDSAAHLKKYADEIRSIDEELFDGRRELNEDWLNDQQDFAERAGAGGDYSAQQDYYDSMYSKLQEMIKAAKDYGLDEASDYVQELYDKVDQLQSDILASVRASFEDFESYMDDFDLWKGSDFSKLDWLKHELNEIIALYDKGQLSWEQYTEARNDVAKKMYDTQRDSLEEILDLTMDMIKAEAEDEVEAIEDQIDAYQKLIDKKKELLQDTKDEADHEEEVAEKVKEIAELQSKIAQLSLDDSREATAKKSELETQLAEKQKELSDLQRDYALDQALDALDKTQEAFEDEKDAEKDAVEESVDSWQKLYEKAIKRIEGDWDGLYSDLLTYSKEHRDSIDGPDSLVTAWKNATSAMQEYNNSFEDAYNNIGDLSINPNSNQSSEAQAILQKMQANSALANSLGKSTTPDGRNLHKENEALAQEYYELTGQKLVYNNGWRLDNANGNLAYNHSSSTNKTNATQTTTSKKDTSSTGSAYEATKAKFGSAPTGSPNLKVTSTGSDVKKLQYFLKEANFLDSSVAVDGQFWSRTEDAVKALQRDIKNRFDSSLVVDGVFGPATAKYLPKYHTGGIVGNAGSINDTEVLALLKKGEWVLDDTRKQNLKAMFANLKDMASGMMSSFLLNRMQVMRPAAATVGGDTFAPQITVSIQHNGSMTDKDAKEYGNMVANTALDQLKSAFAKRGKR